MSHAVSDGNEKIQAPVDGASVTLRGRVDKTIPSLGNSTSDAVQIVLEGAEDLYREIRIPNHLQDGNGGVVALQRGAQVEITIQVRTGK